VMEQLRDVATRSQTAGMRLALGAVEKALSGATH